MSMKIHKPSYDSVQRIYTCDLADGFRLSITREDGVLSESYDKDTLINSLLEPIIEGTKGWFSKPLTTAWLKPRIRFDLPTGEIPTNFEGVAEFITNKLLISKEDFTFCFVIANLTNAEKVVIEFKDEEPAARRVLEKADVLKARRRAARALFKAEILTQEYLRNRGTEDTDWEEDDEDEDE
jgi:hypothetical protein